MADKEESSELFHKLLEAVHSLEFKTGIHVNLCNAIKKVREESSDDVKVERINTNIHFKIYGQKYIINLIEKQIHKLFNGSISIYLKYTITSQDKTVMYIKTVCESVNHICRYLNFCRDIIINYEFELEEELHYRLEFENINYATFLFNQKSKTECITCSESDDSDCEHCYGIQYVVRELLHLEF